MASPVPQKDDVERWTVEQVAVWLRQMELTDCCEFFLRKGIDGRSLMELTEEGLVICGRELSIRNRKKIMKLIKQIENQYLFSTGKLQPNQVIQRQPVLTPNNPPQYNHDQEKESSSDEVNDDDDGFSSTEFDDDVEQEPLNDEMHSGFAPSSTDSGSGEDLYLIPLPAPPQGNRTYPTGPAPRPPPTKPTSVGGNPPEKRPPMPLPFSGGVSQVPPNQNSSHQRLGGKIGGPKLPPGHADLSKRNQPLLPSSSPSSEPPRRPPPIPGPAIPSSGPTNTLRVVTSKPSDFPPNIKSQVQLGEWSSKKYPEPPPTQNSSGYRHISTSNSNNDGASTTKKGNIIFTAELQQKLNSAMHITNFKTETTDTGNEYEVVENPSATFTGRESHSGSPPGFVPPKVPPPLPQRNQDGRDGNRLSANLQQPSVGAGSNVTPNRQNSSGLGSKSWSSHTTGASNINKNRPPAVLPGPPSNIQNKNLSHSSVPNSQDWSQQQIRLPKHGSSSPHLASVFPPKERAPVVPIEGAGLQNASGGLPIGPERISIGDGESIELTPLYRTLLDRPYFHVISRSKSKQLLENALDGVYLIRPSTRSSDPLTLSLLHNGRTYNINIRRRQDGLYALGKEKVNEVTFSSVDEIVSTYTKEPIKLQSENLQSGKRVTLTSSPPKVDRIYVKMPNAFKKKY